MAKTILVTGASGFAGSYLGEYLLSISNDAVYGTYLSEESLTPLVHLKEKINFIHVDLTQKEAVETLIEQVKPDTIYHLAAFASPSKSFDTPLDTLMNNITSEVHLLEAIRKMRLTNTKILIVSSADIYGRVPKESLPITEDTLYYPTTPYAVSKIAQDYLALQYYFSYTMRIIRARPFNHIGPRQLPHFVVSSFAQKIARIEKGKSQKEISVGNLSSRRDFTDVRDIVRAYTLLIEKGKAGDAYNIGSGKSYLVRDVLDMLLSFATVKDIQIVENKDLFRISDTPDRVCDYTKIQKETGWEPKISLAKSLKEILDYWRNIV